MNQAWKTLLEATGRNVEEIPAGWFTARDISFIRDEAARTSRDFIRKMMDKGKMECRYFYVENGMVKRKTPYYRMK